MTLLPEDFQSKTWKRLTEMLEQRLEDLRESNDVPSYGPEKTALIRGQISMVKEILALGEPSASPVEDRSDAVFISPVDWQKT
jgi:hypothetical protein